MWLIILTFLFGTPEKTNVSLSLKDIRSTEGKIQIAIYDNEEDFLETPVYTFTEDIKNAPEQMVLLKSLPSGKYAIAVFHDKNGNGKMDKNLLGIPTESFGFSNNRMGFASPPDFEECVINTAENTVHTIDLINY